MNTAAIDNLEFEQWLALGRPFRGSCGCPFSELEMPEFGVFTCPIHGQVEV